MALQKSRKYVSNPDFAGFFYMSKYVNICQKKKALLLYWKVLVFWLFGYILDWCNAEVSEMNQACQNLSVTEFRNYSSLTHSDPAPSISLKAQRSSWHEKSCTPSIMNSYCHMQNIMKWSSAQQKRGKLYFKLF